MKNRKYLSKEDLKRNKEIRDYLAVPSRFLHTASLVSQDDDAPSMVQSHMEDHLQQASTGSPKGSRGSGIGAVSRETLKSMYRSGRGDKRHSSTNRSHMKRLSTMTEQATGEFKSPQISSPHTGSATQSHVSSSGRYSQGGSTSEKWGTIKIIQMQPDEKNYDLQTHVAGMLQDSVASIKDKIRLELAVRLQNIQVRVNRALLNVGMEMDYNTGTLRDRRTIWRDEDTVAAELESRMKLLNRLRTCDREAAQRVKLLEEIFDWLDSCKNDVCGGIVPDSVLQTEKDEIDETAKNINEAMAHTIQTVSKLKTLGYKLLSDAGYVEGSRKKVKEPPKLINETEILNNYSPNMEKALGSIKKCLEELEKTVRNPYSRAWFARARHQLKPIGNSVIRKHLEFIQLLKSSSDGKQKLANVNQQLFLVNAQVKRLEGQIRVKNDKIAEFKEEMRNCEGLLRSAYDRAEYFESKANSMKADVETLQTSLSHRQGYEGEARMLRQTLENMMKAQQPSLSITNTPFRNTTLYAAALMNDDMDEGKDAAMMIEKIDIGVQFDATASMPEALLMIEKSALKQLHNEISTLKRTSQWKSKLLDELKKRVVYHEGAAADNYFKTLTSNVAMADAAPDVESSRHFSKTSRESRDRDSASSTASSIGSRRKDLNKHSQDSRELQAKLLRMENELAKKAEIIENRSGDMVNLQRDLILRFDSLIPRKAVLKNYAEGHTNFYDMLRQIEASVAQLKNMSLSKPKSGPGSVSEEGVTEHQPSVFQQNKAKHPEIQKKMMKSPSSVKRAGYYSKLATGTDDGLLEVSSLKSLQEQFNYVTGASSAHQSQDLSNVLQNISGSWSGNKILVSSSSQTVAQRGSHHHSFANTSPRVQRKSIISESRRMMPLGERQQRMRNSLIVKKMTREQVLINDALVRRQQSPTLMTSISDIYRSRKSHSEINMGRKTPTIIEPSDMIRRSSLSPDVISTLQPPISRERLRKPFGKEPKLLKLLNKMKIMRKFQQTALPSTHKRRAPSAGPASISRYEKMKKRKEKILKRLRMKYDLTSFSSFLRLINLTETSRMLAKSQSTANLLTTPHLNVRLATKSVSQENITTTIYRRRLTLKNVSYPFRFGNNICQKVRRSIKINSKSETNLWAASARKHKTLRDNQMRLCFSPVFTSKSEGQVSDNEKPLSSSDVMKRAYCATGLSDSTIIKPDQTAPKVTSKRRRSRSGSYPGRACRRSAGSHKSKDMPSLDSRELLTVRSFNSATKHHSDQISGARNSLQPAVPEIFIYDEEGTVISDYQTDEVPSADQPSTSVDDQSAAQITSSRPMKLKHREVQFADEYEYDDSTGHPRQNTPASEYQSPVDILDTLFTLSDQGMGEEEQVDTFRQMTSRWYAMKDKVSKFLRSVEEVTEYLTAQHNEKVDEIKKEKRIISHSLKECQMAIIKLKAEKEVHLDSIDRLRQVVKRLKYEQHQLKSFRDQRYSGLITNYEHMKSSLEATQLQINKLNSQFEQAKIYKDLAMSGLMSQKDKLERICELHRHLVSELEEAIRTHNISRLGQTLRVVCESDHLNNQRYVRNALKGGAVPQSIKQITDRFAQSLSTDLSSKQKTELFIDRFIDIPGLNIADEVGRYLNSRRDSKVQEHMDDSLLKLINDMNKTIDSQLENILRQISDVMSSRTQPVSARSVRSHSKLHGATNDEPSHMPDPHCTPQPPPSSRQNMDGVISHLPNPDSLIGHSLRNTQTERLQTFWHTQALTTGYKNAPLPDICTRRTPQPPNLEEMRLVSEARVTALDYKSTTRTEVMKGPKHQRRLETVKGYCIDKYHASLPLSTASPALLKQKSDIVGTSAASPLRYNKTNTSKQTTLLTEPKVKLSLFDVHFIDE